MWKKNFVWSSTYQIFVTDFGVGKENTFAQ